MQDRQSLFALIQKTLLSLSFPRFVQSTMFITLNKINRSDFFCWLQLKTYVVQWNFTSAGALQPVLEVYQETN